MSADLAAYTAEQSGLDALDRQSVVALLERGKTWLTMAVERDAEIGDLVEFKGQAETVRTYTVQKQLGKDAELAAAELVRRAERGIGVAIRKGQESGEIRRNYDNLRVGQGAADSSSLAPSPTSFVPAHELSSSNGGIYAMTDGVTDEQFESGIEEAKAEGNLSKANVVRKVTGKQSKPNRPEVLRGTRRIDSHRVMSATVEAAANAVIPSLMDEIDYSSLGADDLTEWISSLDDSLRTLRALRTTLHKELTNRG